MEGRSTVPRWWKTSHGKFVIQNEQISLDSTTRALVQDFSDAGFAAKSLRSATSSQEVFKLVRKRLEYKPVHQWLAWMMAGNDTPQ